MAIRSSKNKLAKLPNYSPTEELSNEKFIAQALRECLKDNDIETYMEIHEAHFQASRVFKKRYRNYKEHLIEKLKDLEYASEYLNAALEESLENNDPGTFKLAFRDVVEAHGGIVVSYGSVYQQLGFKNHKEMERKSDERMKKDKAKKEKPS